MLRLLRLRATQDHTAPPDNVGARHPLPRVISAASMSGVLSTTSKRRATRTGSFLTCGAQLAAHSACERGIPELACTVDGHRWIGAERCVARRKPKFTR